MGNKLLKPFTRIERAKFIDENNGLTPFEDESAFYMLESFEEVQGGEIVDVSETEAYKQKQSEEALSILVLQAKEALSETDIVMIRAYESGIAITSEWKEYRASLRAIVNGSCTDSTELPTQPNTYPDEV